MKEAKKSGHTNFWASRCFPPWQSKYATPDEVRRSSRSSLVGKRVWKYIQRGPQKNKQYGGYSIFGLFLSSGHVPVAQFSSLPLTAASIPESFLRFFTRFLANICPLSIPRGTNPFTSSFSEPLNSLRQQIFHRMCSSCCQGKLCENLSLSLSGTNLHSATLQSQVSGGTAW